MVRGQKQPNSCSYFLPLIFLPAYGAFPGPTVKLSPAAYLSKSFRYTRPPSNIFLISFAVTGSITPFSQMMAVISRAGVTSKAGL